MSIDKSVGKLFSVLQFNSKTNAINNFSIQKPFIGTASHCIADLSPKAVWNIKTVTFVDIWRAVICTTEWLGFAIRDKRLEGKGSAL